MKISKQFIYNRIVKYNALSEVHTQCIIKYTRIYIKRF